MALGSLCVWTDCVNFTITRPSLRRVMARARHLHRLKKAQRQLVDFLCTRSFTYVWPPHISVISLRCETPNSAREYSSSAASERVESVAVWNGSYDLVSARDRLWPSMMTSTFHHIVRGTYLHSFVAWFAVVDKLTITNYNTITWYYLQIL